MSSHSVRSSASSHRSNTSHASAPPMSSNEQGPNPRITEQSQAPLHDSPQRGFPNEQVTDSEQAPSTGIGRDYIQSLPEIRSGREYVNSLPTLRVYSPSHQPNAAGFYPDSPTHHPNEDPPQSTTPHDHKFPISQSRCGDENHPSWCQGFTLLGHLLRRHASRQGSIFIISTLQRWLHHQRHLQSTNSLQPQRWITTQ
jgi:hypothetical protein